MDESFQTMLRCIPHGKMSEFIRDAIEKFLREECPTCKGKGYLTTSSKRDDEIVGRAAARISYVINFCWVKVKYKPGQLRQWVVDNWPESNGDPSEQAGKFVADLEEGNVR